MATESGCGEGARPRGELGCGSDRASSRPIRRAPSRRAHAAFQARHGTAYWPDMRPALRATTEMAAQPPKRGGALRASDSEPAMHLASEHKVIDGEALWIVRSDLAAHNIGREPLRREEEAEAPAEHLDADDVLHREVAVLGEDGVEAVGIESRDKVVERPPERRTAERARSAQIVCVRPATPAALRSM